MRGSDLRIGWPVWVALAVIVAREPIPLALAACALIPFSRIRLSIWAASVSAAIVVYWAAGTSSALLYFLIAIVTSLASCHIRVVNPPEWWKELQSEIVRTRARIMALPIKERIREALAHLPRAPRRRVRLPVEIAVWCVMLSPLLLAARSESAPTSDFVAASPQGEVVIDRAGRYHLVGASGGLTIEFDGARVRVIEADCPEKRCMRQGSLADGVIVCVPNRIVIRPRRIAPEGVDAWTG